MSKKIEWGLSESGWWSIEICFKKAIFFTQNFYSKALRKFSMRRMTLFNISGRLSKIISLRSKKKSESYDTPNRLYVRKRSKSWDFEKFTFRIGLVKYRDMLQNAIFSSEFFFQRFLENFLRVVWPCSIYLEGCLRSYLYARKKIRVIRDTN